MYLLPTSSECREAREKHKWSIDDLASLSSVPTETILRYERDKVWPHAKELLKIWDAFFKVGTSFDEHGVEAVDQDLRSPVLAVLTASYIRFGEIHASEQAQIPYH